MKDEYINITIRVNGGVMTECAFSANTPCMLADEIRDIAKMFYKQK